MMRRDVHWERASEVIAERTGLHFPRERLDDLRRGLAGAAQELGLADAAACADWLLTATPSKEHLQVLAGHLTIGETYFFREAQTFQALAERILPDLIHTRRGRDQRLRIWSAACCTGEEPYSLAILLHQLLPDLRDWQVTIAATDISARFLHKAAAGVYGAWSFRGVTQTIQQRYFSRGADGRFAVLPEIKRLVTFAQLNLAENSYPSLATGTNAMDLILCRNVLMYFSHHQARKAIRNLHHALVDGGWLAVSPSEASQELFREFATVMHPGAIFYRKPEAAAGRQRRPPPVPADWTAVAQPIVPSLPSIPPPTVGAAIADQPAPRPAPPEPWAAAQILYGQGRYAEAADRVLASFPGGRPGLPALSLLVRALANQGLLDEALVWCDRWIAADKLDPAGRYLHAVLLLELGEVEPAQASLQRAIYLDPGFVLAHFALGNLARRRGRIGEANRHFANALAVARRYPADQVLPDADGLTAGRLAETIAVLKEVEA